MIIFMLRLVGHKMPNSISEFYGCGKQTMIELSGYAFFCTHKIRSYLISICYIRCNYAIIVPCMLEKSVFLYIFSNIDNCTKNSTNTIVQTNSRIESTHCSRSFDKSELELFFSFFLDCTTVCLKCRTLHSTHILHKNS